MSFEEYWNNRKNTCKFWDAKSEEDKHLNTWLNGMSAARSIVRSIDWEKVWNPRWSFLHQDLKQEIQQLIEKQLAGED